MTAFATFNTIVLAVSSSVVLVATLTLIVSYSYIGPDVSINI